MRWTRTAIFPKTHAAFFPHCHADLHRNPPVQFLEPVARGAYIWRFSPTGYLSRRAERAISGHDGRQWRLLLLFRTLSGSKEAACARIPAVLRAAVRSGHH